MWEKPCFTIPLEIKNIDNIFKFKKDLKTYLLHNDVNIWLEY